MDIFADYIPGNSAKVNGWWIFLTLSMAMARWPPTLGDKVGARTESPGITVIFVSGILRLFHHTELEHSPKCNLYQQAKKKGILS